MEKQKQCTQIVFDWSFIYLTYSYLLEVGGDIYKPDRTKYQNIEKQRSEIFIIFKKTMITIYYQIFLFTSKLSFLYFTCPLWHWHVFMCIYQKCHWNIDPYLNYTINHDHSLLLLLVNDLGRRFELLIFSLINNKKKW